MSCAWHVIYMFLPSLVGRIARMIVYFLSLFPATGVHKCVATSNPAYATAPRPQTVHKRALFSARALLCPIKYKFTFARKVSNMPSTESAEHALALLARNCEQIMHAKIAALASSVDKLSTLRNDPTEKRLDLLKIMFDHEKYIIMLQEAHEDAISNVLPVVANMDEHEYAAGSWKVQDAYACNCSQWNYKHRCHGVGHFGWSTQEYIFTPVGCNKRNSHE